VITLDNEEKSGRSYLKYAAIFVLGLGLTASVSYTVYQKKIATETVLLNGCSKQVNNKIQEATFSKVHSCGNSFCKESKMSYHHGGRF
jgi:hypothetical protein